MPDRNASKRFTCNECTKVYTRKEYLIEHEQQKHSLNPKIFECIYCKKEFSSLRNLKSHSERMHVSSSRSFTCIQCNKYFRNKRNFEVHLSTDIHSKCIKGTDKLNANSTKPNKPIRFERLKNTSVIRANNCFFCQQVFRSGRKLHRHIREMHFPDPVTFECVFCKMSCKNMRNLKVHSKKHYRTRANRVTSVTSITERMEQSPDFIEPTQSIRCNANDSTSTPITPQLLKSNSLQQRDLNEKIFFFRSLDLRCKPREHLMRSTEAFVKKMSQKSKRPTRKSTIIPTECYRRIDQNEWHTNRPSKMAEVTACLCSSLNPCDPYNELSPCHNVISRMECSPENCQAQSTCRNRRFQFGDKCNTQVRETNNFLRRGYGLFAGENIPKNSLITEYVGEVINIAEKSKRMEALRKKKETNFYFFKLAKDLVIDASCAGNFSRFANHSCNPNAQAIKWLVEGFPRIGLFAEKDILKGEEITFMYDWHVGQSSSDESYECRCGSTKCRGFL